MVTNVEATMVKILIVYNYTKSASIAAKDNFNKRKLATPTQKNQLFIGTFVRILSQTIHSLFLS